jgi:hypothetical protein
MAFGRRKLLQAASCLVCVVLAQRNSFGLGGTEFSGGRLTGPILDSLEIGSLLFVLALVFTFVRPRIAAVLAILASLLCLPLYLYFIAPGPFRRVFRGEYSVPLQANFVWDRSAILGVLTVAVAMCICIWNLRTVQRHRNKDTNSTHAQE